MSLSAQERRNNIAVLRSLLESIGNFYCWEYDPQMVKFTSNCPNPNLDRLFEKLNGKAYVLEWLKTSRLPFIIWTKTGMVWIVDFEYEEEELQTIHVIGPLNSAENVAERTRFAIAQLDIPESMGTHAREFYRSLPSMSVLAIFPYVQVLHKALTGENLPRSEIRFQQDDANLFLKEGEKPSGDRRQFYMREQAVLQNIRDGNMNYQEDWDALTSIGRGVRVDAGNAFDRGRLSVVTFIGLCVRAAIEGGVTPDVAYSRGDSYIQTLLYCKTVGELQAVNHAMYEDLIQCVRDAKVNTQLSRQIRLCCDYIDLHLEDEITVEDLASRVGYTDYYLTRKFRKEVGVSVNDYIRNARIERAQQLLRNTTESIQDISDRLHFCSRSYFSDTFRKVSGMPPAAYREMYQKL